MQLLYKLPDLLVLLLCLQFLEEHRPPTIYHTTPDNIETSSLFLSGSFSTFPSPSALQSSRLVIASFLLTLRFLLTQLLINICILFCSDSVVLQWLYLASIFVAVLAGVP